MARIDAAASESIDELIGRAGAAVARTAIRMLGGTYGRRVVIVEGQGNNGRDGAAAAAVLRRRGVSVVELDATGGDVSAEPLMLPACDLVIDAAYGTGFRGAYTAPTPSDPTTPVLAVDIASGIDGRTGVASGRPVMAERTVTFAAMKPGVLLADGPRHSGTVETVDIGLDIASGGVGDPMLGLVTDDDVREWVPRRATSAHKWDHAVWVVGGAPGMSGAPHLAAMGAAHSGAGYVRGSTPGASQSSPARSGTWPIETVGVELPSIGWDVPLLADLDRISAVVMGPGLGRAPSTVEAVQRVARTCRCPLVIDGDALWALDAPDAVGVGRTVVMTPHDGEFTRLQGAPPGEDRVAAAQRLAARSHATVLLKGPTTIVADPNGRVAFVTSGDDRLATAGTGDVLSGVVGAFLSRGADGFAAAAAAAHVHGRAGRRGHRVGLVASDLPPLIADVLSDLVRT